MNRALPDVQSLPVLADVVVEIDHDLQAMLIVEQPEELNRAGIPHPIRRFQVLRFNIKEGTENRMTWRNGFEVAIGVELLQLDNKILHLGIVQLIAAEIVHQHEAAAIEVLAE